jgi:hypothetical protein
MNDNPQFSYARCSIAALARLLNAACGASAIHRLISEELCRRWALAAKTKPSEQPLLFTGAEWSRTIAVASGKPRQIEPNIQQPLCIQQQLCSGYAIRWPA